MFLVRPLRAAPVIPNPTRVRPPIFREGYREAAGKCRTAKRSAQTSVICWVLRILDLVHESTLSEPTKSGTGAQFGSCLVKISHRWCATRGEGMGEGDE